MQKNRVNELAQMLEENPGDLFLKYALAMEFTSMGNFEKARRYYEDILNADKAYLAAYYQLGKVCELLGDLAGAKKVYTKGILLAAAQGNQRTLHELKAAYQMVVDEEAD